MTAIKQPDGFFAVNRSGEFFSHYGRQARDLHDKYQQGTRREIEDLVKREHAKVDGQRFTTIAAVYSDGRIDQHPLSEETPPEPAMPAAEPEQAPAVSESETGAGADQTPTDPPPASPSTEIKISNAEFMVGLFGPLSAGHHCWTTAFATPPNQASGEWTGRHCTPESVADAPHGNAYMSVATFIRSLSNSLRRDTAHFAGLHVVVLDDTADSNIQPTYKLETSPGNYQIGFKLSEPITDVGVASRLAQSLAKASLVKPDSTGNNAVRYVRLPVACNTKSNPPFKCRLHTLDFDITYTLDELIDELGIPDRDFILRGGDRVRSNIKVGHGTPFVGDDYLASDQPDDEQLADLESAIDYLCGTPFADDRDNWIKIGLALRTYIRGRGLWLKLSASSGKFRPDVDPQNWETFRPATAHWKQVFNFAQGMGWQNPCTPSSEAQAISEALLAGTPGVPVMVTAPQASMPESGSTVSNPPWLQSPTTESQARGAKHLEASQILDLREVGVAPKRFSFDYFALNGKSSEMKRQMLDDVFVLGSIAILGQITVIYAPPNAGKTLITIALIIKAISEGKVNASDIYYINADDNQAGLVKKLEIAERYGFKMLAPGHGGSGGVFDPNLIKAYLKKVIEEGTAKGIVLILDTAKKFTDLMDKKTSTEFMKIVREFSSHGGTVILLAHVNKHRDVEGKLVAAGTTDLKDDADCAYIVDVVRRSDGSATAVFENIKSRGDNAQTASYKYVREPDQRYEDLVNSVSLATDRDVKVAREENEIQIRLSDNHDAIQAITETIQEGIVKKTELIASAADRSVISKNKIKKVLHDHTGEDYLSGDRWSVKKAGDRNTQEYQLLFCGGGSDAERPDEYQRASNGE